MSHSGPRGIRALRLILLLGGALAGAVPVAAGQEQEAVRPPAEGAALPLPVGPLQIATAAQVLADSADRASERITEGLEAVGELAAEVDEAERQYGELQALLASMVDAHFVRLERLSRLQDRALIESGSLEDVREALVGRIGELEEIEARWIARRQPWRSLADTLQEESGPDLAASGPEVTAVLARIEEVIGLASAAATLPLALRSRLEALHDELTAMGDRITRIQDRRAESRFERTEPPLFSAEHRAQLRAGGWRAWNPTANIEAEAYLTFVRNTSGLLVFHILLALLAGGAMRGLRVVVPDEEIPEWSGLPEHPWALGLLVSVVVAMTRVTLAPPLWDVLLWSLFAATAAILARRVVEVRALRLTVYLLAVFYPAFLLLEVSGVPEPVFNVGLAVVAGCAVPIFLILARDVDSARGSDVDSIRARTARSWPLLLGTGIWVGVLIALILGFDALARWALHATAMSVAVAFVVLLGFVLVGGADTTLSRLGARGPLVRRAALLLAQRSTLALRVVTVVVGALVLCDIWGVSGSPITTWQSLLDAGFTVGSVHLTVGRLLLGAFVVYLTVVVAGLVGTLAKAAGAASSPDGTGGPLHAGRGVTESVTRIGQYVLFTIGVVIAFAAMGVQLQNFAIIAGALGIGVGFGLQNVVNNFASGLILLFERPVRVGDTVVVGDTWGTIRKIGLRSTLMLTLDESEMIVPNGDLVSEKVINWTLTSPIARVFLPVGVAYGSPIEEVQEILIEAAFAHPSVLKEPPPQALFMAFGDSSLEFELRVWVQDVRLRLEMRSAVLADMERRLRDARIQIPFPQRDLHLRSVNGEALDRLRGEDRESGTTGES